MPVDQQRTDNQFFWEMETSSSLERSVMEFPRCVAKVPFDEWIAAICGLRLPRSLKKQLSSFVLGSIPSFNSKCSMFQWGTTLESANINAQVKNSKYWARLDLRWVWRQDVRRHVLHANRATVIRRGQQSFPTDAVKLLFAMTPVFAGAAPWQAIHDGPSSKASGMLQNAHLGYQAQVDPDKFRVVYLCWFLGCTSATWPGVQFSSDGKAIHRNAAFDGTGLWWGGGSALATFSKLSSKRSDVPWAQAAAALKHTGFDLALAAEALLSGLLDGIDTKIGDSGIPDEQVLCVMFWMSHSDKHNPDTLQVMERCCYRIPVTQMTGAG